MKRGWLLAGCLSSLPATGCSEQRPPKVWERPTTVAVDRVLWCLEHRSTFERIDYLGHRGPDDYTQDYCTPDGVRLVFSENDFNGNLLKVFSFRPLSHKQLTDLEDCRELLPASLRQPTSKR